MGDVEPKRVIGRSVYVGLGKSHFFSHVAVGEFGGKKPVGSAITHLKTGTTKEKHTARNLSARRGKGHQMRPKSESFVLLAAFIAWAMSFASTVHAQPIMLRPAEYVNVNGSPLDPGSHAIPCVCDWNNDGLKDLIVGYRNADKVALYLNEGTDSQPVFSGFVNVQADGTDIYHPSGGCGAPAPWVCDYNGDGKKDLLVGTGAEGYVYFYRNTNTDADPVLASGVELTVGGSTLDVGIRATPYVHDWDEDGLNDLLCGDGNGSVHFFKNVGTSQSPSYMEDHLIEEAGGNLVYFGYRSAIRVYDWDGDGLKDLLGSGSNNVSWCKNVGTNSAPSLETPAPLRAPLEGTGLADIDTGYRMRLELADWNNDNVTDLLIGDDEGYVFYYEAYHFAFTEIGVQDSGQVIIEWNSADHLAYDVLAGITPDDLRVIRGSLPSGGATSSWTDNSEEKARFYRIRLAQ